jgi:hypothetical protein
MAISYPEGHFSIELPEDRSFRLESCDTYVQISGKGVKEMDFGWIEAEGRTLWLMEFKDYDHQEAPDPEREHLVDNLSTKVRDVLTMVATAWAETDFGEHLHRDLRDTCSRFPDRACAIRPLIVLNLSRADASRLIGALKNEINAELEGIREMFGISSVTVLPVGHPMIEEKLEIQITQTDQE